jgi:hypothetical protein
MKASLRIIVLLLILIIVCLGFLVYEGYHQPWTGFAAYTNGKGELIPPRKLWDWLDLLIVPLFLALAAWFLDSSRKASEARVELDRQRHKILDDYLTCMTGMLLKEPRLDGSGSAARDIARIRTLTAVRALDGGRKAQLLQFLFESRLINKNPAVQLTGADFSRADLDEAVLRGAELRGVYFGEASFKNANLDDADLRGSDFSKADLTGASLDRTDLTQANLTEAKVCDGALANAITDQALMPSGLSGF